MRLLPGLIVAVAACQRGDRPWAPIEFTVDSTGSFPVARSIGSPPSWRVHPGPTVGTSDGGQTEFGSIRSVLLGQGGLLYVVDAGDRRVAIFDSAGTFRSSLGREGAGPAEYRSPYSLAWLGDSLALLDPGSSRIGLFRPDGGWAGSWRSPRITGDQSIRLYRTGHRFWSIDLRPIADRLEFVFVGYPASGPADTMVVARPTRQPPMIECTTADGGISSFVAPFAPGFIVLPTPDGNQLIINTDRYRLLTLTPSGDTARAIERTTEPTSISDSEWDSAGAELRTFRAEDPAARCRGAEFERPAWKPPIRFAFFDDVGRLWVELVTPTGPRFEVFESSGRLLASVVALPTTGGVDPAVRNNRLALVGADSAGAPIVRTYSIATTGER